MNPRGGVHSTRARQLRQDELNYALIEAIESRQTSKGIALLNAGADANATDIPHKPLMVGTLVSAISALLQRKPESKERYPSALMLACADRVTAGRNAYYQCSRADESLLRALLSHGARADTSAPGRNPFFVKSSDSLTALDTQIICGSTEVVKLLIEHGAQPNRSLFPPSPPLYSAVAHNRVGAARVLLEHGADVQTVAANGATVIHMAAYERCVPMLDLLLSQGLDIDAQDNGGWTPLMDAVQARPNGPNYSASVSNRSGQPATQTVLFLLRHGAAASIKNRRGQTSLILANSLPDPSDKRAVLRLLADAESRNRLH